MANLPLVLLIPVTNWHRCHWYRWRSLTFKYLCKLLNFQIFVYTIKNALYQTVLVGLLFVWNTETRCFGIEVKQPKQTKTTRNFLKNTKICRYQTVLVSLPFDLVQSKHKNSLFFYRRETTETKVLFRIVPKLVFGSSFGCFESKLASKDTLLPQSQHSQPRQLLPTYCPTCSTLPAKRLGAL